MRGRLAIVLLATATQCIVLAQQPGQTPARASWLDLPLKPWNTPGAVPRAPVREEPLDALSQRCDLKPLRETPAQRALAAAGWIPFFHVARQIVQGDIEILGGMTGSDGMCRPTGFNTFVFVAGRFAGTLSPLAMTSREDGSIGAVRVAPDGTIAADFARYGSTDPLCCPSSHVSLRYRIDRTKLPVVVPTGTPAIRR